ncbi:MAG: hypothetical protein ABI220_04920 [Candidatus Saccharimonadales bacterium]
MKFTNNTEQSKYEAGFASIIIALILIIVLSLLTVGFAELMRHSQQRELDRHLGNQAYYAAESGVNDAVQAMSNGFSIPKITCPPYESSPAGDPAGWQYLSNNTVDNTVSGSGGSLSSWTCLLINPNPSSLVFNPVSMVTPKTFIFKPIDKDGGNTIAQLDVYWQDTDKTNQNFRSDCGGVSCFPVSTNWGAIGMLRLSLTPLSDLSREGLISNTYTAFLYPNRGGVNANGAGVVNGNTGLTTTAGDVLNGECNKDSVPRYCHVELTGIPASSSGYLVSLRSIYSQTDVYLTGSSLGAPVSFDGAQTMIDSTGKAQNVLKRIQVRIPTRQNYPWPGFDAEGAGAICKDLSAYPGSVTMGSC